MFWPGPAQIYDFIARPMIAALPVGSKMIATGVIAPFLVPMKVTLAMPYPALPWVFYQLWAFIAPACTRTRRSCAAAGDFVVAAVHGRRRVLLFFVFGRVSSSSATSPQFDRGHARHRKLSRLRDVDVPGVRRHLRGAGGGGGPGPDGHRQRREAEGSAAVRDRRRLRHRRYRDAADIVSQLALALPMCLLFELGLLVAPAFVKATDAGRAGLTPSSPPRGP